MPQAWWDIVATFWQAISDHGGVLLRWVEVRQVLIPKLVGSGHQPLGILSILWRVGTRLIVRELRSWVATWDDPALSGGLPERSVIGMHGRLHADFRLFSAA